MFRRPEIAVLAVLLLASIALNAYLALRSAGSPNFNAEPAMKQLAPVCPPETPPTQNTETTALAPLVKPASSASPSSTSCETRANQLESDLAKTRARLDRFLPPSEKFQNGTPNPRATDRIRPTLERILNTDGGQLHWTVECRGSACRLQILEPEGVHFKWSEAVQADEEMRRMVLGMQFHGGSPTNDPVTGEPFYESEAYFNVSTEPQEPASGMDLAKQLVEKLKASDAVRSCTNGYGHRGWLVIQIHANEDGFNYRFGGTLGATPAGHCIAARLREIGASLEVPRPLIGAVLTSELASPPE
jgi:hypothetical protein